MNKQITAEGNRLIAEFMGGKLHKRNPSNNKSFRINPTFMRGFILSPFLCIEDLEYHCDWNWLMPVAKKCIKSHHDMRMDIYSALDNVDMKALWAAVVEFIKFYNKNIKSLTTNTTHLTLKEKE